MRLTWPALLLIICIVIFSIFVANVTNFINVDRNLKKPATGYGNGDEQHQQQQQHQQHQHQRTAAQESGLVLDDGADHLMWFLQVLYLNLKMSHF